MRQAQDFTIMDLLASVHTLKLQMRTMMRSLLEVKQSGPRVHPHLLLSTTKMKFMPLSFPPHTVIFGRPGGLSVSQQCTAQFHPGAVQSSCPIKQAASPGPLPQASSQRLFLHHLFSVTHLQLNCGGCCIPPITTSYTSP